MPTLGIRGGVAGTAEATTSPSLAIANSRKGFLDFSSPAFWSTLYAAAAFAYILFMYFGHGGSRGLVL